MTQAEQGMALARSLRLNKLVYDFELKAEVQTPD